MKLLSPIGIAALIVALGLLYALGYKHGHDTAADEYNRQQAAVTAQREQALRAEYERQIAVSDETVRQLRAEKAAIAQRARQLEEEIAHVTTEYRPAPGCRA